MDGNYNGGFRVFFYIKKLKSLESYYPIIMIALAWYVIIMFLRKTIVMISQDRHLNMDLQKRIKFDKNFERLVLFPRGQISLVSDIFLSCVSWTDRYFWFLLQFVWEKNTAINQIYNYYSNNLLYPKSFRIGGYL
jgi:hypothetical protein